MVVEAFGAEVVVLVVEVVLLVVVLVVVVDFVVVGLADKLSLVSVNISFGSIEKLGTVGSCSSSSQ